MRLEAGNRHVDPKTSTAFGTAKTFCGSSTKPALGNNGSVYQIRTVGEPSRIGKLHMLSVGEPLKLTGLFAVA